MKLALLSLLLLLSAPLALAQSLPAPRCGDGQQTPGEFCDDGNNFTGDGCDARCMVEPFFKLPEKAHRRALVGTLISYPLLILLSPQLPEEDGAGAASVLGLTTGLAPSFGHFYTRAYGRGALSATARYFLNSGTALSIAFFSALNRSAGSVSQENAARELLITSFFLVPSVALSLWDIRDAPRSITRMSKKGKYNLR